MRVVVGAGRPGTEGVLSCQDLLEGSMALVTGAVALEAAFNDKRRKSTMMVKVSKS
jgi:hypothetical protein